MAEGVTNGMLLEHMQAMKYDLVSRIDRLAVESAGTKMEMHQKFEEARLHRQALQEDLEATMRIQMKHAKKLRI